MKETKFMRPEFARVSSKGQVVIPQNLREKTGIQAGSVLEFVGVDSLILLKRVPAELTKKEEKDLRDIAEAWKDFEEGRFKECSIDELGKRMEKWVKKK